MILSFLTVRRQPADLQAALTAPHAAPPPLRTLPNPTCCSKPHLNVGTIGHVDHGKTSLTAAITRVRKGFNSMLHCCLAALILSSA